MTVMQGLQISLMVNQQQGSLLKSNGKGDEYYKILTLSQILFADDCIYAV